MSNRQLTRKKFLELLRGVQQEYGWTNKELADELERQGYLALEPEEPKKLTALEACRVIADGGQVKDYEGHISPNLSGAIGIDTDFEPYTEVEETIEINTDVWVNVYPSGNIHVYDTDGEANHRAHDSRIACEKFHLHRVIKKGE